VTTRDQQRALFDTRRAVRQALAEVRALEVQNSAPLVLVGLSGGADSLALAAAVAFEVEKAARGSERPGASMRAGAVVIDHGLQAGSDAVAERAAAQAERLGLDPVIVRRVTVSLEGEPGDPSGDTAGGPEAAAREARYAALAQIAAEEGAAAILTAHTRDDQAEQVLLALARGSGSRSIGGIPPSRALALPAGTSAREGEANHGAARGSAAIRILRPFLVPDPEITRATTELACAAEGLEAWQDPHNEDHAYRRVRVRREILPRLERELGPGVARALARSADLAREDADALDALAEAAAATLLRAGASDSGENRAAVELPVHRLAELPVAISNRVLRLVAREHFGAHLSREHTRAVAALVHEWRGQGPVNVPGLVAQRSGDTLTLRRITQ